jgi:hypothetical protein
MPKKMTNRMAKNGGERREVSVTRVEAIGRGGEEDLLELLVILR